MFKHLKRGGCELSPGKVECRHCDGQLAGGFQDDGGILLCSNHLTTQAHTSNTLVHEAVHAFDACRAKVDWGNCVHHACSEIRAAALSGDCNFSREVFLRRNFGFAKQFQRCVKRRAELSVSLNPYCDELEVRNSLLTSPSTHQLLIPSERSIVGSFNLYTVTFLGLPQSHCTLL